MEAALDDSSTWNSCYVRNNHKHLKCFPGCAPQGHVERSFCGTSVTVKLLGAWDSNRVTVVGGFGTEPWWKAGDYIDAGELESHRLTGQLLWATQSNSSIVFSFAPPRWTFDITPMVSDDYAFFCWVLLGAEQREFKVAAALSSPRFKIVGYRNKAAQPIAGARSADLKTHQPFIHLEPIEASARLKRAATPYMSYTGFLMRVPGEVEALITDIIQDLSLRWSGSTSLAPSPAVRVMQAMESVDQVEAFLPPGVNLRLVMRPMPMRAEDEIPDVAGRYELSDDVLMADLELIPMNALSKWAVRRNIRRAVAPSDRCVVGWQADWNAFEVCFPSNLMSSSVPMIFALDASVRAFKVFGPLAASTFVLTLQCWAVGPCVVVRYSLPDDNGVESLRVDRCMWRKSANALALMFVYQSVSARGWGGAVLDEGLARLSEDGWVVNKVTVGELRSAR